MMYDAIIIGAGTAGLFCAAHMTDKNKRVLLLDASKKPGLKLLVSGGGQCNFTHSGSIEDYLDKYGQNGRKIRKILNTFTNNDAIRFFQEQGLKIWEREDGKVFPASKKACDIVNTLLNKIKFNGVDIKLDAKVANLKSITESDTRESVNGEELLKNHIWQVVLENGQVFKSRNIIVATGGITYPKTGSDGAMFEILEKLGDVDIVKPRPALVPIFVESYPFSEISGISIRQVSIKKIQENVKRKDRIESYKDDILFTHKNLSGPLILNYSRYLENGDRIEIDFLPDGFKSGQHLPYLGCKKNILNLIIEETSLPKAFVEIVIEQACKAEGKQLELLSGEKAASLPGNFIKTIEELIHSWKFAVSGKGALDVAMVTAGGVSMSQVSPKTMESKKHPGLHFVGEVLDVDGNTGGYNIQFAFSSSYIAAQHILQLP